jgi:DNA polymerase elongation subunit (family B)
MEQIIDIDYKVIDNQPVIYLFKRLSKTKKVVETIKDFKPYFYVNASALIPNDEAIEKVEPVDTKSLFGEPLIKIITKLPEDVAKVREKFLKTYEADVLFPLRYLIDKTSDENFNTSVPLRVAYLDIEVEDVPEFPNPKSANNKILAIGVYDNFSGYLFLFLLGGEVNLDNISLFDKNYKLKIFSFKDEKELLTNFIKFVNDFDFDVIAGWNVEAFDLSYIINRAKKLGVDYKKLSPINKIIIDGEFKEVKISGRGVIDLCYYYRKLNLKDVKNYTLEYIASIELNLHKTMPEFEIGKVHKLYNQDILKFIEYNLIDVVLTKLLDDKLNLIKYLNELRCLTKVRFIDLKHTSNIDDVLFLTHAKAMNVALETKVKRDRLKTYQGALVFKPDFKLYKNVAVFDFKSLYPSIIITLNLSPETVNQPEYSTIINGVKINFKKQGFVPSIFDELFKLREKYKNLAKKAIGTPEYTIYYNKQFALKTLINSIYGMFGYYNSRIHNLEIAELITYVARELLTFLKNYLANNGFEVVYGDTDSIMVFKANASIEDFKNLEQIINQQVSNEIKNRFKVENPKITIKLEKIFEKLLLFGVKKRYVGYVFWKEGSYLKEKELCTVGVETIRSDTSEYGEEFLTNIFKKMLDGESKEQILAYVKTEIEKIKNKEIPLIKLLPPRKITKINYKSKVPALRAFNYSVKYLGLNLKVGEKFWMLPVKAVKGLPPTDVVALTTDFKIDGRFLPDYDELIRINILIKLDNLGFSFNANSQPQSNLMRWSLDTKVR